MAVRLERVGLVGCFPPFQSELEGFLLGDSLMSW